MNDFIEIVERYRTKDGAVHDTEKDASDYISDKCCEVISDHLRKHNPLGKFTANEIFCITLMLGDNTKQLNALYSDLGRYLGDE